MGINLLGNHLSGVRELASDLQRLVEDAAPDTVEVCPHHLGVLLDGRTDDRRAEEVAATLLEFDVGYTVHAPHRMNLMDLSASELHRGALDSSIRFAARIGAPVVVCHAGQRYNARDARLSFKDQLAAERDALRASGDVAGPLGVTVAVENSYPEPPILRGERYAPAARPAELAEQVAAVDHPAVGLCLDTGHAAVGATSFGFDFLDHCLQAAPLVYHVHLHDNMSRPEPSHGEPKMSERHAYGIGDLHLPPGDGIIALQEFLFRADLQNPTCCVELSPGLRPEAGRAVKAAHALADRATDDAKAPVRRN